METSLDCCEPRDGCSLAPYRLPNVLVMAIPPSDLLRKEANQQGVARIDMQNGGRESQLGRTSHPRGIANPCLRFCRTHGISLGPEVPNESGEKESTEAILEQPSGTHAPNGL